MANAQLEVPILLRDHVDGIVHEDIVSDFKQPASAVTEAINLNFDIMGDVQLRSGTTSLGTQITASSDILGLHQFLDEGAGTDNQLVTVVGTQVYYFNGSDWVSIRSGLTADAKADFTNFLDRMIMVNGSNAVLGWNGDTAASFDSTNLTNAQAGNYIETWRSRLWIGNTTANPSRLFYSTIASSTGTITWADAQFIDISPGDGEDITGLIRSPKALLVFKPRHMYRVFSIRETDPDPQLNVGTHSNKSIVETKAGVFFHDWDNSAIFLYQGGLPREVSRPIQPYLEQVTRANRDKVAGWKDADNVYMSVGDVTLNGVTISNLVVRYTLSTQVWTLSSYPTQILAGADYDDGTNILARVVGDNDGNVFTFDSGITDNGTPITYSLITRWYDLSGVRSYTDTVTRLAALHRNAEGAELSFQVNDGDRSPHSWVPIGQIGSVVANVFNTEITGHRMRFRLFGTSVGEPFVYQGIEILRAFSNLDVE